MNLKLAAILLASVAVAPALAQTPPSPQPPVARTQAPEDQAL